MILEQSCHVHSLSNSLKGPTKIIQIYPEGLLCNLLHQTLKWQLAFRCHRDLEEPPRKMSKETRLEGCTRKSTSSEPMRHVALYLPRNPNSSRPNLVLQHDDTLKTYAKQQVIPHPFMNFFQDAKQQVRGLLVLPDFSSATGPCGKPPKKNKPP